MAEAVGLVAGAVALAGLFNNVIDCFEYVHIAKSSGGKFQTSLLKLDNAKLRLSRWGVAMKLSGGVREITSLPSIDEKDRAQAEQILGQILKLFDDAGKISAEFQKGKTSHDKSLLEYDKETDLDLIGKFLNQKMETICSMRQNRTRLSEKVKFALYKETHLTRLIDDITALTNDLVELFPAIEEEQKELCASEVKEFSESLRVLEKAAKAQDPFLETALSEILKSAVSSNARAPFYSSNF
jgi:hypothetical protein